MAQYLAGIDIGTTGSKGMVFDLDGRPLASSYFEYPCMYPAPGWVEQDADLVVASAMRAMKEAVAKSGVRPEQIASFSLSAQRSCGIFLDRAQKQLRPMISWQDNRSVEEVGEIARTIDPMEYYRRTGFPNSTTWLAAKLLWVRKHEPAAWEKTHRVVQMHDYFLKALGADDYYIDLNDAGFFGLFDSVKNDWDGDLLRLFGFSRAILPKPLPSGTCIGKVSAAGAEASGLKAGTPVSIGAGDQSAGSLGAGIVQPGAVSISMGTAGAVTVYLDKPFRDPSARTMVTSHTMKGRWLMEGYQAAAASVYRWFRDEIAVLEKSFAAAAGADYYAIMDERIAKVPAGAKGLLAFPYFASAGTPRYNPAARGMVLGLTFAHDRYCLARAFMEGITLDMRDMIRSVEDSGIEIRDIRILGGPTKSEVWNRIQAEVYGMPVQTLAVSDATVLGAAILGGVGAGIFSSIAEGAQQVVRLDRRFDPDPRNVQVYRDLYGLYCRAYEALQAGGVFPAVAALQA